MNERKNEKLCEICNKGFANTFTLNRHRTQYHQLVPPKKSSSIKCHICDGEQRSHADLIEHLNAIHSLSISIETKSFACEEEFLQWKQITEHITNTTWTCNRVNSTKSCTKKYFVCNRSGNTTFKTMVDPSRNKKVNKAIKSGPWCAAHMTVKISSDGYLVSYCMQHTSHQIGLNFNLPSEMTIKASNHAKSNKATHLLGASSAASSSSTSMAFGGGTNHMPYVTTVDAHKSALDQKTKYLIFKLGTSKEFLIKKATPFIDSDEEGVLVPMDQYSITYNYIQPHDCQQICADCKFCIHYYKCDCNSYKHKSQFCKHLHMISSYLGGQNLQPNVLLASPSSVALHQTNQSPVISNLMLSSSMSGANVLSPNNAHFGCDASYVNIAEQQFERLKQMHLRTQIDWSKASTTHSKQIKDLMQLVQQTCDLVDQLPKKEHLSKK